MDQTTLAALLKFLSALDPTLLFWLLLALIGTPMGVIILVLWFSHTNENKREQAWASHRQQAEALLNAYREDMREILEAHAKDVARVTRYYEDNVKLVEAWQKVAEGFQDTVVLNTQTMQRMVDVCTTHQFCPLQRVGSKAG